MYDDLIKTMRHCVETCDCPTCPVDDRARGTYCIPVLMAQAADAIEELKTVCRAQKAVLEKLAAYKDAEEQGRLVVLPCKEGDTVYWNNGLGHVIEYKVYGFEVIGTELRLVLEDFEPIYPHSHLFLSREEAEKALEEQT